ncbi:hypothetical protein LJD42_29925, partial [Escherichia coli]|nr:hypothetical protein [Escherichia coli]
GGVRRTNSVNPLRGPRAEPAGVIDAAEKLYGALGRDYIVRVPTIADEMESHLVERGYRFEGGSTVLHCDLRRHRPVGAAAAELSREMTPGWSRDSKRISGWSDDEQAVFTDMIAS